VLELAKLAGLVGLDVRGRLHDLSWPATGRRSFASRVLAVFAFLRA
jgi:hypothetical protein